MSRSGAGCTVDLKSNVAAGAPNAGMTLFTTNKHHTIGVIPPSLKWSVVGTSQGINPAQAYLLRTFSGDPTRWCDNRGIKVRILRISHVAT